MRYVNTVWRAVLAFVFPPDPHDLRIESLDSNTLFGYCADGSVWVKRRVRCLSPLRYGHRTMKRAIAATKYRGNETIARLLGEGLAPYLAEEIAERRLFGAFTDPLCVPVPLHPSRSHERGFNQSERVAQALLNALGDTRVTYAPQILVRTRHTQIQAQTAHKADRVENMRGAFSVPDKCLTANRDIILLDDVITTGSTLYEASRALRDAGARDVLCVAVAH